MTNENLPSISLVLIVRDEAQNLSQLLPELSPLFQEIIVVDTGSSDGTVSMAEAAGAKVIDFQWCDDFSEVRNFGIEAASCDWVLTVDADERIAASDFSIINQAVASGDSKGFFFTQRNYTNLVNHPEWRPVDGKYPEQEESMPGFIEAHQVRLFPNLPELRYHGCIHETVRGFRQARVEKEHLPATIHHYGHMQTGDPAARRNDLYSRLTREKLRQNPTDSDALYQMAIRYIEEGHPDQGRPFLEQLVASGEADHPAVARGNIALGRLLQGTGESEAALVKLELAVQQQPQWLLCWMETLSALVNAGRWSEVAKYLAGARMIFPDEILLLQFECRLLMATGAYGLAEEKANILVQHFPHWSSAEKLATLCHELIKKEK